jgi:nucleoside-diphosphate-sugar epimerase
VDLAKAIVACLKPELRMNPTYNICSREIITARKMAEEIALQMGTWTVPLPVPTPFLWPACLIQEIASKLAGKPNVLSLQKYAELKAPGWVADPTRFEKEVHAACPTTLRQGISKTLTWYREEKWL